MTAIGNAIHGFGRFWTFPTLTWMSASDLSLRILCGGGIFLAALLTVGIQPAVVLPLLWLLSASFKEIDEIYIVPATWIPHNPTIQNFPRAETKNNL